MKSHIILFLLSLIFTTIQSAPTKNTALKKFQNKQYVGLYDYFRKEIENLEQYERKAFMDMKKRKSMGEFVPLYDEFKKRLDHFIAALVLDNNIDSLATENRLSRFSDYKTLAKNTSSGSGKNMRLNRGFLNYFGFDKTKTAQDNTKRNQLRHQKENKLQVKPSAYIRNRQPIATYPKNKKLFVKVKPGNLYDEYKRQIQKASDVFAKSMRLRRNAAA